MSEIVMRKLALKIGMIPQKSEWLASLYGPQCEKTWLCRFVNNKGAEQPAYSHILISIFVIHLLKSNISILSLF